MTDGDRIDPVYKYIDGKARSLKGGITRLKTRIENLELLGLQDQISKLDDNIKSINTKLIAVSRVVAFSEIDSLHLHMQGAISNKLPANDPNKTRLTEYIAMECAKAVEKNKISSTPLDVLKAFRTECQTCSKEYDLGAFKVKPY